MNRWQGFVWALVAVATAGSLTGQTRVDLKTESKNVDFSGAPSTKPLKVGATLPAACTTGDMFFKSAAPPGQNLYGCTSANTWTQETSSGGASAASQLTDFSVTLASPTTLSAGAFCAPAAPCNVRFGSVVYSILTGATVTLAAGSGTAYLYISSSGQVTVGHNLTLTCDTGCVAQGGVTAFPSDSIPLFTWTASAGTWDVAGHVDFRSFLASKSVASGVGLVGVDVSGISTLSVDATLVALRVAAPAAAASACAPGVWAADGAFYYVCTALNTWKRTAIASW